MSQMWSTGALQKRMLETGNTQGKAQQIIILIALATYYSNKKHGKERYRIDVLQVCIGNE